MRELDFRKNLVGKLDVAVDFERGHVAGPCGKLSPARQIIFDGFPLVSEDFLLDRGRLALEFVVVPLRRQWVCPFVLGKDSVAVALGLVR